MEKHIENFAGSIIGASLIGYMVRHSNYVWLGKKCGVTKIVISHASIFISAALFAALFTFVAAHFRKWAWSFGGGLFVLVLAIWLADGNNCTFIQHEWVYMLTVTLLATLFCTILYVLQMGKMLANVLGFLALLIMVVLLIGLETGDVSWIAYLWGFFGSSFNLYTILFIAGCILAVHLDNDKTDGSDNIPDWAEPLILSALWPTTILLGLFWALPGTIVERIVNGLDGIWWTRILGAALVITCIVVYNHRFIFRYLYRAKKR